MENLDLLRDLCQISAPSGFEEPIIKVVKDIMPKYTDAVEVDRLGNIIGWRKSKTENANTIMVTAHMDEVGFVVRRIEDNGLLRLWRIGGIPEKVIAGQVVAVISENGTKFPGIIGGRPHHVQTDKEKSTNDSLMEVFVDVGLKDKEQVQKAGINIGSPATWWPFYHQVGDRIMSKSIDNRLALFVLLDLMRCLKPIALDINLAFVATVHEEWSAWGSITSSQSVNPDIAIALDIAIASDIPNMELLTDISLGQGPVINTYMFHPRGPHMGTIPNKKLKNKIIETAKASNIPYQLGTFYGGMTDSSYLQYSNRGIPVADIGIPTRYSHYPVEVSSLVDAELMQLLLEKMFVQMPASIDLARE